MKWTYHDALRNDDTALMFDGNIDIHFFFV